jgi:hypothetical protein
VLHQLTSCVTKFASARSAGDFEGWSRNATPEEIEVAVTVLVASLKEIIDSTRATHRPKDQMTLPYDEVRASAGTWNDVLGIDPHRLVAASDG